MTSPEGSVSSATAARGVALASFLGDGGILDLEVPDLSVDGIRVELDGRQFLHLQSIGITTADGATPEQLAALATVAVSSWYQAYGEKFSAGRLLDFDHVSGTQVHTKSDQTPWIEIGFSEPLDIRRLRLRNVSNGTWARAIGIRVSVRTSGRWHSLFDASAFISRVVATVMERVSPLPAAAQAVLEAVVIDTVAARYAEARKKFEALELEPDSARRFKTVLNSEVLAPRHLEWTIHGPTRCFRYWTPRQKRLYTVLAATIAEELGDLTPHVCFGFGAALCVVRDGAFIPHDDDLDIIIGFEPHEATTLVAALHRVEDFLRPLGYAVTGNFSAHRQVSWGGKAVDVFVGLFEGDVISWYPGARGALTRQMMFPASVGTLYGVPVPLPHQPAEYLEAVYGPGWVSPDPNFKHSWDRSAYADLRRPPRDEQAPAG